MMLSFKSAAAALLLMAACFAAGGCSESGDAQKTLPAVRIGIDADFPPYTYRDGEGGFAGLDIDLAKEATARMGRKAEFVPVKWPDKDSLLNKGAIDCIWSCYSMDGREEKYRWSKPYMKSGQYVVIRTDSDILGLEDLNGKTIAAQATTKFMETVKSGRIKAGRVLEFDTAKECLDAVMSSRADATGGHLAVMLAEVRANSERHGLEVLVEQPLSTSRIGVAFKKGADGNADELDKALDGMFRDGTAERIAAGYFLSKDVLTRE